MYGVEQLLHVVKMQASSWFVEYKKDVSLVVVSDQKRSQFDALRFTTRERR